MRSWPRRLGYLLFLLLWLLVMSVPTVAVVLASRGQIQIGNAPSRHLRLFHIQEIETEGIGIEWKRPFRPKNSRQNHSCTQTNITYLVWKGTGENTRFCQCINSVDAVTTQPNSCTP